MEPLNQEQNSNKSVDQNPQTPQFQQPEKTNKFGKHFIFLFTLLIISLVSAGLVFVINLVSDRNEEYGFEYPSDFKFSEDNPSLSLTEEQVIEEFERGLALKNETPNFERTETGYIIGGTGGNTVTTPRLVWGDMDNDGDEDVAGLYTSCGGSCGHNMFIIINNNGKAERLSYTIEGPEPFDNTGKVMVRDVFINDSLISITYSNITDQKATITYELEGDVLVLVSDARTYRNEEYGFEFKYPENWISPKKNILQN